MQACKSLVSRCTPKRLCCSRALVSSPSCIISPCHGRLKVSTSPYRVQHRLHSIVRYHSAAQERLQEEPAYDGPSESTKATDIPSSDLTKETSSLKNDSVRKSPETEEVALRRLLKSAHDGASIRHRLADHVFIRGCQPQLPHYEALILENCSPEHGSASNVGGLIDEALNERIPVGKTILAAALKALVIHPDPLLLAKVLDLFAAKWISLDENIQHLVVANYIRSDQLELAQEQIEQISKDGAVIEPWLYVLFIQAFVRRKAWDSIIRMCYELQDDGMRQAEISPDFWKWLLTEAVSAKDLWTIKWIWNFWVERMLIEPEHDTLHSVLKIAADNGLPFIAESAFEILKHSAGDELDKVKASLKKFEVDKAYEAAGQKRPPPNANHLTRGGIMWRLFCDTGRGSGSSRIEPWAALNLRSHKSLLPASASRGEKGLPGEG